VLAAAESLGRSPAATTAAQLDAAITELDQLHDLLGHAGGPPVDRPQIAVLGTFEVTTPGGRRAEWRSRKARQLLKILIARRGSPIHREELMGLLWPDVEPDALRNRVSVALSAVRRAVDPDRCAADLIDADSETVRLRTDVVDLDVEQFLDGSRAALEAHESDAPEASAALVDALHLHRGPALPDEPYAEWAAPLQREVRTAHLQVARALGVRASADGDHIAASDAFHRLVEADPFDEHAHRMLLDSLTRAGAVQHAERERQRFDSLLGDADLQHRVVTDR
jgi:DNA-binding SARP family transcriptional activator